MAALWLIFFISIEEAFTYPRVQFSSMLSSRTFIVSVIIFISLVHYSGLDYSSVIYWVNFNIWCEVGIEAYFFTHGFPFTFLHMNFPLLKRLFFLQWIILETLKNDHSRIGLFLDCILFHWYICFSFASSILTHYSCSFNSKSWNQVSWVLQSLLFQNILPILRN